MDATTATPGQTNAQAPDRGSVGANVDGTVLAALVLGNLRAATAFGFDSSVLQARSALTASMLDDPDGRVPVEHYVALWEAIERDPRALAFALWRGKGLRARDCARWCVKANRPKRCVHAR